MKILLLAAYHSNHVSCKEAFFNLKKNLYLESNSLTKLIPGLFLETCPK